MMKKPSKLLTIATIIIIVMTVVLSLSIVFVQVSHQKLQTELVNRGQASLAHGVINGGIQFALASRDIQAIQTLCDNLLVHDDIYAIEVRDVDNLILYRKEADNIDAIRIDKRQYEIHSPFDSIALDAFANTAPSEDTLLGYVVTYYSTENIENRIDKHFIYTVFILLVVVIAVVIGLALFFRYNDQQLKKSLVQAIDSKNRAEEAEAYKDDFIKAISHDIRTPVGVVSNLLAFIVKDVEDKKLAKHTKEQLNACYHSANILYSVTEELFNFDNFQKRQLVNQVEAITIQPVFDALLAMYEVAFQDKNINFSIQHDAHVANQHSIVIDHHKLVRALENILDNALKFTEKGAVTLTWRVDQAHLNISVQDSGIGIPENKIDKIFEKHTQLENPVTNRYTGRGLGLYYTKCLLDVMGAKISVFSTPNLGTRFDISIPIALSTSEVKDLTPFDMGAYTALIIDDDEATCLTLETMLSGYGIACEKAYIPELGLSRLIKNTPDIVFIDYHMPETSGDMLVAKAKQALLTKEPIYVCITADPDPATLQRLKEEFKTLLKKPFSAQQLHELLQVIYQSREETKKILDKFDRGSDQ